LTDTWFRHQAADSLETISRQEGYHLNTTELRMLSGLELSHIVEFADRLDPGLCRATGVDDEQSPKKGEKA
jgi:hypothetical protein